MVLIFNTPIYLACKWAISKGRIISLWRLVSLTTFLFFNIIHWFHLCACFLHTTSSFSMLVQVVHRFLTLKYQVCKIVEGQRYSKRLNEKQITALLKVTCQRPQEREKDILQVNVHYIFPVQVIITVLLQYCLLTCCVCI